jgi:hypothetical protein
VTASLAVAAGCSAGNITPGTPGKKQDGNIDLEEAEKFRLGPQELISVAFPSFYVSAFLPYIKFTRQDLLHEN